VTSGGKVAWTRRLGVAAEFAVGPMTREVLAIEEVPLT